MLTLNDMAELARSYRVNHEDVLLIALNAYGTRSAVGHPRARMVLRLRDRPDDPLRLGIPLAREESPFETREGSIWLGRERIADVEDLEDDDALLGYFRNHRRVLILNSNARSHCTGCVFCPNTLEGASDPRLAILDDLDLCFRMFEVEHGWTDLSHLQEVNLVTGCFQTEQPALEHLELIRSALDAHHSTAQIGFLTSVIRSDAALRHIAERVGKFLLVVTLECFSNRDQILKHSKAALLPEEVPDILARAKAHGHDTGFTYIVGLEPIEDVIDRLAELGRSCTRFPNFQVFQAHNRFMARFAAPGADRLEFFLHARRRLEDVFAGTDLRPSTWANYRPLWFFSFAGEPLIGPRI